MKIIIEKDISGWATPEDFNRLPDSAILAYFIQVLRNSPHAITIADCKVFRG